MNIFQKTADRIVREFRSEGWPAKCDEIARFLQSQFSERDPKFDALRENWPLGTLVRKTKGSRWQGKIVGYYSTELTPYGVSIESSTEIGSVQIYPVSAIEKVES